MNSSTRTTTCTFRPRGDRAGAKRQHRLPVCTHTGLARFRDRHQARASATAMRGPHESFAPFYCPDCKGVHLERMREFPSALTNGLAHDSTARGRRRYVLLDVENITSGAACSRAEMRELWAHLRDSVLSLTDRDHVVVGAARGVARKFQPVLTEPSVKWVVGANAPDAADRALLAAIDLRRVSRRFDELVIVSGDHAFAALARMARASGLHVHVVTGPPRGRRSTLARELAAAADVTSVMRTAYAGHTLATAA